MEVYVILPIVSIFILNVQRSSFHMWLCYMIDCHDALIITCVYSCIKHMAPDKGLFSNKKLWYEPTHDKTYKMACAPVKTQISLFAWGKLGSLATHWVHSKDCDQTWQMPRLIWVFTGHTCYFVGFVGIFLLLHKLIFWVLMGNH